MRLAHEKDGKESGISDFIESCDFHLHESFGLDGPVNVKSEDATAKATKIPGQKRGEIQVTYNSRGVFDMVITINFQEQLELEPVLLEFPLVFTPGGTI